MLTMTLELCDHTVQMVVLLSAYACATTLPTATILLSLLGGPVMPR